MVESRVDAFEVGNSLHPRTEEQRIALHKHTASLLPDDTVTVYTHKKKREMTVQARYHDVTEETVPVDWIEREFSGYAVELSGKHTDYLIVGNTTNKKTDPSLVWPQNRGITVYGIAITDRDGEIYAEERANDLLRQVALYDGQ